MSILRVVLLTASLGLAGALIDAPLAAARGSAVHGSFVTQNRGVQVYCAAEPPAKRGIFRRALNSLSTAVVVGVAGVMMRTPYAPAIARTAEEVPTVGVSKAGTTMASLAMGGGICYWSYRAATQDDREEQERIKKETERLEKLQSEYTDIEDGVIVDEDLFASLRKRTNGTSTSGDDSSGGDDSTGGGSSPPEPTSTPPTMDSGGGAAVLEPPSEPPADAPAPGASPEDIERLKRMFGSSED